MMHRAWSSIVEVPYCFSRSYVKFQGHSAPKIVEFYPYWAFPDSNSSLNSPIAMKCCTKLETAKERCPIVFHGHPSNFKATRDKTSPILTQIGRFRTIGRSQLSNPSDLPCSTGRGNAFCLRHVGDARHVGDGGYSPCLFGYVTMWVGASQLDARQPIRTSLSETKEAVYRPMRGASWDEEQTINKGTSFRSRQVDSCCYRSHLINIAGLYIWDRSFIWLLWYRSM